MTKNKLNMLTNCSSHCSFSFKNYIAGSIPYSQYLELKQRYRGTNSIMNKKYEFLSKLSHYWWLHNYVDLRLVFTSDGVVVRVVIKSIERKSSENSVPILLTTPSFTFLLWSSENQIVRVGSRSTKPMTKHGNVHSDWFILLLLLPTPTIWFSLDHKRRSRKHNQNAVFTKS